MQADTQTSPILASVLMISAMVIIGVVDNVVILLAETIGLWQFHLSRAALMLPLIIGLSLLGFGGLWPRRLGPVVPAQRADHTGHVVLLCLSGVDADCAGFGGSFHITDLCAADLGIGSAAKNRAMAHSGRVDRIFRAS